MDQEGKILGKNYFRDEEVNEGFYSKKREGVADVDPKVMEPFIPIPGKPPRKVVIDRQRKLFASLDIEELLLGLGIDYKSPEKHQAEWLPLEPFDDTEYDCRLPEEWIELGYNDDGVFEPIPGKGLFRDAQGFGEWKAVLMNGYDADRSVFTGYWDNTSDYVELTRINLLFNAEDPRIFAQRVAQAHSERIYADSIIRYNFFIDNMPPQELAELDSEQTQRIVSMATAARALKLAGKIENTTQILTEVSTDFSRTMNRIIMEKAIEMERDGSLSGDDNMSLRIPHALTLPPPEPPKPVPELGMVPIPEHDFPEQFSNFCFNSLFIKEEVIRAMVEIRAECNEMMERHRIWDCSAPAEGKPRRLEDFKQIQSSSISNIKFQTQENGWVGRL